MLRTMMAVVEVDLSKIKPMIAMPFHPSNTYTIDELNANLEGYPRMTVRRRLLSQLRRSR